MVDYENSKTIYDLVVNAGECYPEKLFLRYEVNGDIVDVTYNQFITECKAVISWVQEYSVKLGRVIKVGLYGGNSHPYFVTLMAVMAAGSVAVPLDVQMNKDSLADALDRADIDVLFYDYAQDSIVQDIKDKCPKVKDYFIFRNTGWIPSSLISSCSVTRVCSRPCLKRPQLEDLEMLFLLVCSHCIIQQLRLRLILRLERIS